MRFRPVLLAASAAMLLSACAGGGLLNRDRPDEFATARAAPLVIPPDFSLQPPRPGEADTGAASAGQQALQALFGGPQPRSAVENNMLRQAEVERSALGARSVAGDPDTRVVSRGALVQTIASLPQGDGQEATVQVPQ
jgi:hypothetical protein